MEIDSAMLALGADRSQQGLLHIFGGGFDALEVSGVPGQLPIFFVVVRVIKTDVAADETHRIRLTAINPEGEVHGLMANEGLEFKLGASGDDGFSKAAIIIQIQMVVKAAGKYVFVVSVDDQELKRIPLRIDVSPK